MKHPRQDAPTYRHATVETWQPAGQIQTTIKICYLRFSRPAQIIKDAAALVPQWKANSVQLFSTEKESALHVGFGTAEDGVSIYVDVTLRPADVSLITAHLIGMGCCKARWLKCDFPDTESDGGKGLPVPTIADAPISLAVH